MRDWLQQLDQREQVYVLVAAATIALYLLYVLILSPLVQMRDEMAATNERVGVIVERVQAMASELQQLQSSGSSQRNRNLSRIINATTSQYQLTPSRIQSSASGSTQIRFEQVNFSQLLRWLNQVENKEGLMVRDASISQGNVGGQVDASIRVSLGS